MIPYIAAVVIFQLAKWRMSGNPHMLLALMHFILAVAAVVCVPVDPQNHAAELF